MLSMFFRCKKITGEAREEYHTRRAASVLDEAGSIDIGKARTSLVEEGANMDPDDVYREVLENMILDGLPDDFGWTSRI